MSEPHTATPETDEEQHTSRFHIPRLRTILLVVLGLLALQWVIPTLLEALTGFEMSVDADHPYLLIFAFVTFDAIIPIFPSESILHLASSAALEGQLELGWVILGGGLGAVVGDSLLYWLARTVGHDYLQRQLDKAMKNEKVRVALEVLGQSAPVLITLGRYVPGVRFAVNAGMGLTKYSYPKFLLFSAIGGMTWAGYVCLISYWAGLKLSDYPVLSFLTGILFCSAIVGVLYFMLKRRYDHDRTPAEGS